MRAITHDTSVGPASARLDSRPTPQPGPDDILIEVTASAVNRADLLQSRGLYPPPPGASDVLGLECSGRVAQLGTAVATAFKAGMLPGHLAPGHQVCALLAGGGYATHVLVPAGQVMPVPVGVPLDQAASLPEVACTVWSNLFMTADCASPHPRGGARRVLVHGGAGGIGTFAIQLLVAFGCRVAVTCGSADKAALCRELGAELVIDYTSEDFVQEIRDWTEFDPQGQGVDVILDVVGAKYLERNIKALAEDGRLVVIGMQGGVKGELNLADLLAKRGGIIATNLRKRPAKGPGSKAEICAQVVEHVWPLVAAGKIRPQVSEEFPLAEAAAALARLDSGEAAGKLLLRV